MAKSETSLAESLKLFMNVQKEERAITIMLFLWQFIFICVYYVLRPIRRGLFLDGLGNEWMPLVYIGTALVTGVVVWLYSKFSHMPRKKLISSVYGFFCVLVDLVASLSTPFACSIRHFLGLARCIFHHGCDTLLDVRKRRIQLR